MTEEEHRKAVAKAWTVYTKARDKYDDELDEAYTEYENTVAHLTRGKKEQGE
jgi:hypothetical protein